MSEPPVMVSTKDAMYINDILNISSSMIKKIDHYLKEAKDEKLKSLIKKTSKKMKENYHILLEVLNG
jgi:hypothetical protein